MGLSFFGSFYYPKFWLYYRRGENITKCMVFSLFSKQILIIECCENPIRFLSSCVKISLAQLLCEDDRSLDSTLYRLMPKSPLRLCSTYEAVLIQRLLHLLHSLFFPIKQ